MRQSPLIGTALVALLGTLGTATAGTTMYDWNELSPPQADFMAQQQIGSNHLSRSISMKTTPKAVLATPRQAADARVPATRDPPDRVSLSNEQKSVIFRGAIAQAESAPSDFHASMGATLPEFLRLYAFDDRVQSLVPAAKQYDYAKLPGNDILLVDPASRKVVAMVQQKDAVGK
jgi:hypothetical protein